MEVRAARQVGHAEVWADKLIARPDATAAARIEHMFQMALARSPSAEERVRFEKAAAEMAAIHGVRPEAVLKSRDVWKDLAHAMFNVKEFVYLR